MTNKVIATTSFDHEVNLIETEDGYVVTYGLQTRDCGRDFLTAWNEFTSCSMHAAECASLVDVEE